MAKQPIEDKVVSIQDSQPVASGLDGLISADDILRLNFTSQRGKQSINELFAKKVFSTYSTGGQTGRMNLTREDSARIRYWVYGKLRADGRNKTEIGAIFKVVCGDDDEFIGDRLAKETPTKTIQEELLRECRKYFNGKH